MQGVWAGSFANPGRRRIAAPLRLAAVLLWLAGALPASGHKINTSYLTVVVLSDTLKLMLAIDENDLLLNFDLDRNHDQMLWREEMAAGTDTVFAYVENNLQVSLDGKVLRLERWKGDPEPDDRGNMFLNLFFRNALTEPPVEAEIAVDFFDEFGDNHVTLAKILIPGKPLQQAVFSSKEPRQRFAVGEPRRSFLEQLQRLFR
jgi:hypothetical protein